MSINPSTDKHLVNLAIKLGVPLIAESFVKIETYNNLAKILCKYQPSTAENYIWRLHRYLSSIAGFPPAMLNKYKNLLTECCNKYPNK